MPAGTQPHGRRPESRGASGEDRDQRGPAPQGRCVDLRREERRAADPRVDAAGRRPGHDQQRAAPARRDDDDGAARPDGRGARHRRAHEDPRRPATRAQLFRAVRPRQDDARIHPRAGSAGRALRRGDRVAARRLRDRLAPGRPAPARVAGARGRGQRRERLHQGAREAAQGCTHQHGPGHRDRDREPHDGGRARERHDDHRKRGAGARSPRPRQLPQRDGREDPRRRYRDARDRRGRTPVRDDLRSAAGPHRNRHLPRRRCDHRRQGDGQARAAEDAGRGAVQAGGRRRAHQHR